MVKKRKAASANPEAEAEVATEAPPVKQKKGKKAAAAEAEAPAAPSDSSPKLKKKKKAAASSEQANPSQPATSLEADLPPEMRKKKKSAEGASAGPEAASKGSAASTVFVDGVPYDWTAEKIEEFFSDCGKVVGVKAPTWQDSGRSRGFAHVTFASSAAQKKALAKDQTRVGKKGRYLKIEPAKGEVEVVSAPSMDLTGKKRLFVKNLPYDATEEEIAKTFASCGKIVEVRVPTSFGRAKGFAYVVFAQSAALQAAFKMEAPQLRGRPLRLDVDTGDGPKAGFHYRPEAYQSGFGPSEKRRRTDGFTPKPQSLF